MAGGEGGQCAEAAVGEIDHVRVVVVLDHVQRRYYSSSSSTHTKRTAVTE